MSLEQELLESLHGSWRAQALYVAAELGIADGLAEGAKTARELASDCGAHEDSVFRLLRALSSIDICKQRDDGRFEVTPLGLLLADRSSGSLRHWVIWWGQYLWPVWGNLLYSVKTGKSARSFLMGTEGFAHLQNDPRAAAIFNRAMAELTALTTEGIVAAYDFSGFERIVDVGGGHGQLLAAILGVNLSTRGVVLDMPRAIEGAKKFLREAGVIQRCELIGGDFFESIPGDGDLYVLKSVLHDWDDEHCGRILLNCRRAMNSQSRLLLIERVIPARLDGSPHHQAIARTDLNMLIAHGTGERSEAEFAGLLNAAKLRLGRVIDVEMGPSIVGVFAL